MDNKTTAIMQPTYNPWIGYFDLIDRVDIFVFLDSVQLNRWSWQVRNRIKTANGELLLTIPIKEKKKRRNLLIKDALIDDSQAWRKRHLKAILLSYKKAKFFDEVYPFIENLINTNCSKLGAFNINLIIQIARKIGIKTEFIKSSDLDELSGTKDVLLVEICKKIGCNIYVSPPGSSDYIEADSPGGEFVKYGIKLFYHNFEHPTYSQLYGSFLPYMGIFDLLFNEGFENALDIIKKGRRGDMWYEDFRKQRLGLK